MNIDELRSAQSKERQKSDLQQLRESFYGDVAEYVEELEAERERAAEDAEDPFGSPEVQQLTNDIETAKDTAEAIYERRLGKIVKKASLVSAEMANPNDVNGLTAEEQALFADLVERIEENKTHMLDVIAGDAPPGPAEGRAGASDGASTSRHSTSGPGAEESADANAPHPEDGFDADDGTPDDDPRPGRSEAAAVAGDDDPSAGDASDVPDPGNVSAADLMGGEADADGEPAADADADASTAANADNPNADDQNADADGSSGSTGDDTTDDDRATLRVTQDVGEIFGVDEHEYRLDAEDVVTLPEENADILVEQGAAERLD